MQPDYEKSAAAMVAGTQKAIQTAVAPLLKRIEALEGRPAPERGEKGETGLAGHPGKDGVGIAGALIDRSGVLVLTLSDGTTRELGAVVGKDGADGRDGETGPQGERGEPGPQGEKGERGDVGPQGDKGLDGQSGRDGADGKDGRDGFSLEDFDCEPVDERTIKMVFTSGGVAHSYELEFPVIIDRGVYKAGESYARGDAVTWGGSLWIAQKATGEKPDSPESGWRLAVKKGRDGKDAKGA